MYVSEIMKIYCAKKNETNVKRKANRLL